MAKSQRPLLEIEGAMGNLSSLSQTFLRVLRDHGGDETDIERLLFDAKVGGKKTVTRMVRAMLPIWRFVDHPFELQLRPEDFQMGQTDFIACFPEMEGRVAIRLKTDMMSPVRPPARCKYRLRFNTTPVSFDGVQNKLGVFTDKPQEYAGLRELIAFADILSEEDLLHFSVMAPASYVRDGELVLLPQMLVHRSKPAIFPRSDYPDAKIGSVNFFLMREFEA